MTFIDQKFNSRHSGFTLTEALITVLLASILGSIALPNYLNQINRNRQNQAASTIAQIQTTITSYADEFGVLPESWAELNDTSAVMTEDGPATKDNFEEAITLAGGYYDVKIDNDNDNLFTITATRDDEPNLNIIACVNLTNGASDVNQGTKAAAATAPNCG